MSEHGRNEFLAAITHADPSAVPYRFQGLQNDSSSTHVRPFHFIGRIPADVWEGWARTGAFALPSGRFPLPPASTAVPTGGYVLSNRGVLMLNTFTARHPPHT